MTGEKQTEISFSVCLQKRRTAMSDNRNIISSENWVELYATLSNYILEYSSLDPIWIIDEDGNEVRTEEKQDEFIDIVDQVEAIMETVLIKEGE
jgi:hypothetical protein